MVFILHIHFCAISFCRTQDLDFSENSTKLRQHRPLVDYVRKIIPILSYKIHILHAKLCAIPCNRIRGRTTTRICGKTEQQLHLLSYVCTQIASLLFLLIYIYFLYKFFPISSTRNQDQLIPKISKKVNVQRYLLSDFNQ